MATCDICGNEFKNNSGLSGHKQLAHRSESGVPSALDRSPERSPKRSEQLLLEQIQWQLERLEELEGASSLIDRMKVLAVEEHKHGMSDPECPGCILLVSETLRVAEQKGAEEMARRYEAIPGVTKLREIHEQVVAEGKNREEDLITITG